MGSGGCATPSITLHTALIPWSLTVRPPGPRARFYLEENCLLPHAVIAPPDQGFPGSQVQKELEFEAFDFEAPGTIQLTCGLRPWYDRKSGGDARGCALGKPLWDGYEETSRLWVMAQPLKGVTDTKVQIDYAEPPQSCCWYYTNQVRHGPESGGLGGNHFTQSLRWIPFGSFYAKAL